MLSTQQPESLAGPPVLQLRIERRNSMIGIQHNFKVLFIAFSKILKYSFCIVYKSGIPVGGIYMYILKLCKLPLQCFLHCYLFDFVIGLSIFNHLLCKTNRNQGNFPLPNARFISGKC